MEKAIYFAVLTTRVPRQKTNAHNMRVPLDELRAIAFEAQQMGMKTVLVQPKGFDWKSQRMAGWIGHAVKTEQENWVYQKLPLPHVIYENLPVSMAVRGKAENVRRQCRLRRIPIFNPVVGSKLRVNRILEKLPETRAYIPVTRRVRSSDDMYSLLKRYPVVYIKPNVGCGGGVNVTRVAKLGNNRYRVTVDRPYGKRMHVEKSMTLQDLSRWIRRVFGNQPIVQQGIPLFQVNGGQVDFRVMVQRAGDGKWKLTGVVPKIASPGGAATNIVAGGRKSSLSWIKEWAKHNHQHLPLDLLEQAAIEIARSWEKRRPTFGVAGFDMGIDRDGKVWMIEMNPKPSRSLLTANMRKQFYRNIAEFAHYLAVRAKNV